MKQIREGITDRDFRVYFLALLLSTIPMVITFLAWVNILPVTSYSNDAIEILQVKQQQQFARFVLTVGGSLTLVLFATTVSILRSREAARVLAMQMTKKLRAGAKALQLFEKAVESSMTPIVFCDHTGKITWTNSAWETQNDCTDASPCKENIFEAVCDPTTDTEVNKLKVAFSEGKNFTSEDIIMKRNDGNTYDVRLVAYPIEDEGNGSLFVCTVEDISKQKKVNTAKTEFMSLASHQLRTPLTSMRWILEEIRADAKCLSDDQRELVEDGYTCALLMSETIRTMLMLSRIETNKAKLNATDIDLKKMLNEIKSDLQPIYMEKEIKLSIECPALHIHSDSNMLYQVLSNLMDNAAKYSSKSGRVTVRAEKMKDSVRIQVKDCGHGIAPHEKANIFQKFFRGETAVATNTHGTGLGLYLVQSLVTLLHGKITFVSQIGKGTTFRVTLPISTPSHDG